MQQQCEQQQHHQDQDQDQFRNDRGPTVMGGQLPLLRRLGR